jgi:hypothetical protein
VVRKKKMLSRARERKHKSAERAEPEVALGIGHQLRG